MRRLAPGLARTIARTIAVAIVSALASGCFQTTVNKRAPATNALDPNGTTSAAGGTTFKISNVKVEAGATSSSAPTATVFFDTSAQTAKISSFCSPAASATQPAASKPCSCTFSWTEINSSTGTPVSVARSVVSYARTVQDNLVTCNGPAGYFTSEIPNGTQLTVRVVPGSGSAESFSTNGYVHAKNTTGKAGSFEDVQGRVFDNVLRYACYEQFKRGSSVTNKFIKVNNPADQNEYAQMAISTQFCAKKDGGAAVTNCEDAPGLDFSAQAYYFNLFIRESERGDINSGSPGGRYVCPLVKEALGATSNIGTQNKVWPLDKSFALSRGPSGDYPVAVEAYTKLSNGSDPTSQSSSCYPGDSTSSGSGSTGGAGDQLVKSCLGFAAKPSTDGTCPLYTSSTGATQPMFRLRRYVALLPPQFNADGSPVTGQGQAADVIYVLDREVSGSSDSSKPYTMLGPKPCPYSWYDATGAIGVADAAYAVANNGMRPVYAATNNPAWAGNNVDGLQFPNTDTSNSCSATLPILSDDRSVLSLGTVHATNPVLPKVHVRPIQPWHPHYVEDTSFRACAPKASNPVDPPLHFARDLTNGNVRYCAEVYPTQNDNISALDRRTDPTQPWIGNVQPFTSHVTKNSASAACAATTPASLPAAPTYPAGGSARHPAALVVDSDTDAGGGSVNYDATQTCDRTVPFRATGWNRFPLLASAFQTEEALRDDSSFGCTITYDAGLGKKGVASPATGCCSTATVSLSSLGAAPAGADKLSAHLEPDATAGTPCGTPTY